MLAHVIMGKEKRKMRFSDLPLDPNGVPFTKPSFWLGADEYAKIISEINNK